MKIYNIASKNYKEYKGLKLNEITKPKFCKFQDDSTNDSRFVIGFQDRNNFFQIRLITVNGTEVFKSQNIDINDSDDFSIFNKLIKFNNKNIIIMIIIFWNNNI